MSNSISLVSNLSLLVRIGAGCLLAGALVVGCSKKQEEQFPASPPPSAAPSASTTANSGPVATPSQPAVDTRKSYADAEAAMKAGDYEKAVEATLALQQQQKQLSDAQALAVRNQMVRLQQQLAGAVANGDPRAKAAADRLRQAAAHH